MRRVTAVSWIMEPFGEIGADFSLQLSSRTQFAKISNKKVIAENQCEKHKNWVYMHIINFQSIQWSVRWCKIIANTDS